MKWIREHLVLCLAVGAVVVCLALFAVLAVPPIMASKSLAAELSEARSELERYEGPSNKFGPPTAETVKRVEELVEQTRSGYEDAITGLGLQPMPRVPEGYDAQQYWIVQLPKVQDELEAAYGAETSFQYDATLGFSGSELPPADMVPKLLCQLQVRRELVDLAHEIGALAILGFGQVVSSSGYDRQQAPSDPLFEKIDVTFTLHCDVEVLTRFLHALQASQRYYAVKGLQVQLVTEKPEMASRLRTGAAKPPETRVVRKYLSASFLLGSYFLRPEPEETNPDAGRFPEVGRTTQGPDQAY